MAPAQPPGAAPTTSPWTIALGSRLLGSGLPLIAAGVAAVVTAAGGALLLAGPQRHAAANPRTASAASVLASQELAIRLELHRVRAARDRARLALTEKRKREAAAVAKLAAEARRRALEARRRTVLPLTHFRLTARFGASSGLWSSRHTGLDFAAPTGTPVRAVKAGVVVSAGWDGAYGWKLVLRHEDGTQTWYCHLSSISVRSARVAAGERIGRVGSTGNTTGPHLHLEVRRGDTPVDPAGWLRDNGVRV